MHLVAIAPSTSIVALGSASVEVSGLSLRKLSQLIVAYPDLVGLATGGTVEIAALLDRAPDAALAIFALGLIGRARGSWWKRSAALIDDGHDQMVAAFDAAPAGQQVLVLGAIFDLTFKGGERGLPFLMRMIAGAVPAPPSAPESQATPSEIPAASMPTSSSG